MKLFSKFVQYRDPNSIIPATSHLLDHFASETKWQGGALSAVGKWMKTPSSCELLLDTDRKLIKKLLMDIHARSKAVKAK